MENTGKKYNTNLLTKKAPVQFTKLKAAAE